jgi:hypothetical protein
MSAADMMAVTKSISHTMETLFTAPLHGVACVPFCAADTAHVRQQLSLEFGQVTLNNDTRPLWVMEDMGERYNTHVSLYTQEQHSQILKINCQGKGLFKFKDNTLTIDWEAEGTGPAHYFQTLGLALWLELNGVLCIHANALAFDDKAIALMAPSRGGKTTLSAALCKHGFAVMTDDMMALHTSPSDLGNDLVNDEYEIYPSWPVARMWPDSLKVALGDSVDECEKVHQQFAKRIVDVEKQQGLNFCDTPKKLRVIYLLNRLSQDEYKVAMLSAKKQGAKCNISTVPLAKAMILLLQNSILGSAYRALSLESQRLKALSQLLQTVQFKQVTYVSGSDYLHQVCEAIKQDCEVL